MQKSLENARMRFTNESETLLQQEVAKARLKAYQSPILNGKQKLKASLFTEQGGINAISSVYSVAWYCAILMEKGIFSWVSEVSLILNATGKRIARGKWTQKHKDVVARVEQLLLRGVGNHGAKESVKEPLSNLTLMPLNEADINLLNPQIRNIFLKR